MTDLEDDIARIAALRGRKVEDYAAPEKRVAWAAVDRILSPSADAAHDLEWFDRLPEDLRAFIRGQDQPLNAMWAYHLWHEVEDTGIIIAALKKRLAT